MTPISCEGCARWKYCKGYMLEEHVFCYVPERKEENHTI